MNIHGALAGPPPFHTQQTTPVALATSVRFPAPRVPPSPSNSLPASTSAPRGLVPIYHPLRYPSNGHQSKAEITIRVCPVDEVDGGVDGKANRTRERKRKGGVHRRWVSACGGRVSGWRRRLDQWSLPLNWKLRFERPSVDFHPPVLALRQTPYRGGARICSSRTYPPSRRG